MSSGDSMYLNRISLKLNRRGSFRPIPIASSEYTMYSWRTMIILVNPDAFLC